MLSVIWKLTQIILSGGFLSQKQSTTFQQRPCCCIHKSTAATNPCWYTVAVPRWPCYSLTCCATDTKAVLCHVYFWQPKWLIGSEKKAKKKKKNGTVVGSEYPSRAQSVCSLRCGMKSQRKPKECELSLCRLPAAAVAHRPFIAWQQGKPPYHNKMEMRRKREQTKAAGLFFLGGFLCNFTEKSSE